MMKNFRKIILFAALFVFISGCTPSQADIQKAIEQTQTAAPTITNTPTPVAPTDTPLPTSTPTDIPTATPLPQPVTMQGMSDKVVDFPKTWSGASLLKITNKGSSNFVVYNYDSEGEKIDLLVNEIGSYSGTLLIGIMSDENDTTRFSVKSSGTWSIVASPFNLSSLEQISAPGHLDGNGDDVIAVNGDADIITGTDKGDSNFVVYAFTDSDRRLIFNEIAPYDGQMVLPSGTLMLVVLCQESWSFDLTSK